MRATIFALTIVSSSCLNINHKEYKYIEHSIKTNGLTNAPADFTPVIIYAVSDSDAYLKAYMNFCFSNKIYKREFEKSGAIAGKPISFRLLNDNLKDIVPFVSFMHKNFLEKDIARYVSEYQFKKQN